MAALLGTHQEEALPHSDGLLLITPPHSPRVPSSPPQAPPRGAVAARANYLPGCVRQNLEGQTHAARDVDLFAASEPLLDHAQIAAMQRHLSAASAHVGKLLVERGAHASTEAVQPQSPDGAGVLDPLEWAAGAGGRDAVAKRCAEDILGVLGAERQGPAGGRSLASLRARS
ncbi:unnamed protein product [Prorocentrum cordatum]|uniref:Uncharacterized protein n=1 Tax=Prorocentrum cordatum TaxID=2364126 RepID=A0ABN9WL70_9DINO|nr:unnamed protein product [Polarella glacialis]